MTRRKRPPHNAKIDCDDIHELARRLGGEMKRVTIDGEVTEMTWAERSLRLLVDRALAVNPGNRRDLAQLLRMMIAHPDVTGKGQVVLKIFINGAAARLI